MNCLSIRENPFLSLGEHLIGVEYMGHFITGGFATIAAVGDNYRGRNNMANNLGRRIDGVKSNLTDFKQKLYLWVMSMWTYSV